MPIVPDRGKIKVNQYIENSKKTRLLHNAYGNRTMLVLIIVLVCTISLIVPVSYGRTSQTSGSKGAGERPLKNPAFPILTFIIEGNTLLSDKAVNDVLLPHMGQERTSADVERARGALETAYHEKGYPAVLVNIPEQTVQDGKIRLQVIESKIGSLRVTGNRWYTQEKILSSLPSLAPGKVLYVPAVQTELGRINRGKDIKISPILSPGAELGLTDVELKVEDRIPLHLTVELNNRSTWDTTDLRLNTTLRYDNLWQKDHSVSIQYQMSPEKTSEVETYALSYTLPAPWNPDHYIAVYGMSSDSNTTTFGQDFEVTGKGNIYGIRYVMPLSPYALYMHNLTIGVDYKDFDETVGYDPTTNIKTPITYVPFSFSYSSSMPDAWGFTVFSAGLNVSLRGLVTDPREFEVKRYMARGNYVFMTAGVERQQRLPWGMGLFLKVDGQIADQPLISNEQYVGGGMISVRGYKEAEAMGDNAFHGTVELSAPDIGTLIGLKDKVQLTPYTFFDYAWLQVKQPLDSQSETTNLKGIGAGVRGGFYGKLYYEVILAWPLTNTQRTEKYDQRVHFKVGVQF